MTKEGYHAITCCTRSPTTVSHGYHRALQVATRYHKVSHISTRHLKLVFEMKKGIWITRGSEIGRTEFFGKSRWSNKFENRNVSPVSRVVNSVHIILVHCLLIFVFKII